MKLKNLFVWGIALLATFNAKAQSFTVTPSNPTAEDRITIKIDVTGFAKLENVSPLYLWAWSNQGDAPNGSWNSSDEGAVMTQDPGNPKIWTKTIVPSVYYGKPSGGFEYIGFLVKAKDGTGDIKTADQRKNLDPIAFNDAVVRRFPSKFTDQDVFSVYYDKKLDNNKTMKNTNDISVFTQVQVTTSKQDSLTDWKYTPVEWNDIATAPDNKVKMVQVGDSLYRWTIVPRKFFKGLQPGEKIGKIKVHVRSTATPVFGDPLIPAASKGDEIYNTEITAP
jgi:hypothetical protein